MMTITDAVVRYDHACRTTGVTSKYAEYYADIIAEWEELHPGWDARAAACGRIELRLGDAVVQVEEDLDEIIYASVA